MKSLVARLALRKTIGLYVGDREVVLSVVAHTTLGPIEVARRGETCEPDRLAEVLKGLLGPHRDRRQAFRRPVAVGLPDLRVFFSTRPIQALDRDLSPAVLLHEVLQSPSIVVDEMAVDMMKGQPGNRPVASLVSCRRKYLSGLLAALEECGVRPFRAEPAPCALLRAAAQQHRAPRKAKVVLRVFLGPARGLAALVAGELPLVWRSFDLPEGGEAAAVVSACLTLPILGRYCGAEGAPDAILVHGRPDLAGVIDSHAVREPLEGRVVHHTGPALEGGAIAMGLALGCQPQVEGFDLARTLKPRPPVREIFPWGELALKAAILVCASLFLMTRARGVEHAQRVVRSEAARLPWLAKVDDNQLDKERKDLEQKVKAVEAFLSSRIVWTAYTQDLSTKLPESILLKSFAGQCEVSSKKEAAARAKKSYILKLSAPIAQGEGMPKEIDAYLAALRAHPLLRRDFPIVELGDLHWSKAGGDGKAVADFTVVCLPKAEKAPAKGAPGGAAAKGGAR